MSLDADEVHKVGNFLFKRYTQEAGIAPDDWHKASPVPFLGWLQDTALTDYEVAAQLDVSIESAQYIMGMAFDPTGPNRLIALWPYIILSNRTMRHELKSMQLFLVLSWVDGTVVPLSIMMHKDLLENGKLDDASVCSEVTTNAKNLIEEILDTSLDQLHDDRQRNGLFGLERIVQLAQDLVNGLVDRKEVPDADMAAVNQLLLFVATMFPNELPEELKEQVRQQNEAKKQARKNSEGFKGGFDEG